MNHSLTKEAAMGALMMALASQSATGQSRIGAPPAPASTTGWDQSVWITIREAAPTPSIQARPSVGTQRKNPSLEAWSEWLEDPAMDSSLKAKTIAEITRSAPRDGTAGFILERA